MKANVKRLPISSSEIRVASSPGSLDPERRTGSATLSGGYSQFPKRSSRRCWPTSSAISGRSISNIDDIFPENYATVKHHIANQGAVSEVRQRFIGACFTMGYAIESAALFNPSMVPAIDQSDVPPGSVRFLMSLRATGEGHLSSIVFRRGLVDSDGSVTVDRPVGTAGHSGPPFRTISKRLTLYGNCKRSMRGPNTQRRS